MMKKNKLIYCIINACVNEINFIIRELIIYNVKYLTIPAIFFRKLKKNKRSIKDSK